MKKYLLIPVIGLLNYYANAYTLQDVSSIASSTTQAVTFNFDTSFSNPVIMASGKDLVVDFIGADVANSQMNYDFESGYVHTMSLSQTPQKLRAVITNGAEFSYAIEQTSNGLIINFKNQLAKAVISNKVVGKINTKTPSGVALVNVSDIKFKRDDTGGGVVEVAYTGNSQIRVKEQRFGDKLILQLNDINYDKDLTKRIDATDFATPIKYIDTKALNSNQLELSIINRNSWDYAIYQLQDKLIIDIRNTSEASSSNGSDIPLISQGKSNRISLNFQNVDVRALLQLLADFSGYNILVSDSVTGTMSLKLNNVPWDQALQIILNSKGLGMRRDGNVIRIAPVSELSALSKMQQDSQKAQEAIEPIDSLTFRLKYAQAASVQSMLTQGSSGGASPTQPSGSDTGSSGGSPAANSNTTGGANGVDSSSSSSNSNQMLSNRGNILVDTRTNTLIINDTPTRLKDIKDLIDKIDIPVKQVMIEARIVEAKDTFERTLGTRLFLAGLGLNNGMTFSNTLNNAVKINQQGIGTINDDPTKFINSNIGSDAAQKGAISAIYSPNSNTLIGLEVDALELQSQGKTISSPKVITANYQPANIQQGVQIPYQQASSAGNTNIAFVNATLSLQVTPQITEDGNIMLDVNIQKNSPSSLTVQGTPSIDTSSVNTQVLIQDGSTILVGGIYVDEQSVSIEMIPGLGDIPYLGWLFKSQKLSNTKKELLIFITPRIIVPNVN